MANLVRIFSKKLQSKNADVDLDAIVADLMESTQQEDQDEAYTSKVHLSDVWKEIKAQVRHRCIILYCQRTVSDALRSLSSQALEYNLTVGIGSVQQSDIAGMKKLLEQIAEKLGVDVN